MKMVGNVIKSWCSSSGSGSSSINNININNNNNNNNNNVQNNNCAKKLNKFLIQLEI